MAVSLLRVLVLGVIAAAADDVPVRWWWGARVVVPCALPEGERLVARRPPPPLAADDAPAAAAAPAAPAAPAARAPLYQWRRDNQLLNNHKVFANGSLEVVRRKDGGDGVYQCSLHHAGVVLGYPVHLKYAYIESEFWASPENASAAAGQPHALRCDIRSGPPADIAWLKDGLPLPDNDRYIQLDNQLLILDVQEEDAGVYRCKAWNSVVNKTRVSGGGRLGVEARAAAPALLPLRTEARLLRPRGAHLLLPCPATGTPTPKITWTVREADEAGEGEGGEGEGRVSELETVEQVLRLRDLQPADAGLYSCAVEGHPHLNKSFEVVVTEPVVLTAPPASKQSFPASTVRFNCTAAARPPPTVTWYKDGEPLALAGRIEQRSSADGRRLELLIRSVTSDDAGVYQCVARGAAGAVSAWARLAVTGAEAAAPRGVRCEPVAAARVLVRWPTVPGNVTAYTVLTNRPGGTSLPGQPIISTQEIIDVDKPLTRYGFQVRAYILTQSTNRTIASDLSKTVICEGQGVPIKMWWSGAEAVSVSWRQFAAAWPGVLQWRVQARAHAAAAPADHHLPPEQHNYTLTVPAGSALQVRVLGTRALPWLAQNLSLVPWLSTAAAAHRTHPAAEQAPYEVSVSSLGARSVALAWRCDLTHPHHYRACAADARGADTCVETVTQWATVSGLQPGSEYWVRVAALAPGRAPAASKPLHLTTLPEGPQSSWDLSYKMVDASTLRMSWEGAGTGVGDHYRVQYSYDPKLPVDQWASVHVDGTSVQLSDLDLTRELFVMVTGQEPGNQSSIFTIPAQIRDEVQYVVAGGAVRVWWRGRGRRVVHYSQNLTQPLNTWTELNVTTHNLTITGLDPWKPTFVIVAPPGASQTEVITIQPQPPASLSAYLVLGILCPALLLALLAVAAYCVWRRRKRARSPLRSRRWNSSAGEGTEEEGSEMKALAARRHNGAARDAARPLLNGHLHAAGDVSAPAAPAAPASSKTPNGKMRKGRRYEIPLDVSRRSDEFSDGAAEGAGAAGAGAGAAACSLLDTSRADADVTRLTDLSELSELSELADKLPDDNMNSQLRRGQPPPTLQPNG